MWTLNMEAVNNLPYNHDILEMVWPHPCLAIQWWRIQWYKCRTSSRGQLPYLKTNMTSWKVPIFNRKCIFKWWIFHGYVIFWVCIPNRFLFCPIWHGFCTNLHFASLILEGFPKQSHLPGLILVGWWVWWGSHSLPKFHHIFCFVQTNKQWKNTYLFISAKLRHSDKNKPPKNHKQTNKQTNKQKRH